MLETVPLNPSPRRAFTLVETILAVVIVSLTLVAALASVASVAKTERLGVEHQRAHFLAQQLMSEILTRHYSDTAFAPGSFGLGAGEDHDDRTTLDDIDDYHGLIESPPTDESGNAIEGAAGWTRRVSVIRVRGADLGASNADTGLRRVTVRAIAPSGATTDLHTLVNLNSSLAEPALTERTATAAVRVDLRLSDDTTHSLTAALPLLNEPVAAPNLLVNPSWETGSTDWHTPATLQTYFALRGITVAGGLYRNPAADCTLSTTSNVKADDGDSYLDVKSRTDGEAGPAQVITDTFRGEATYATEVMAWTSQTQDVWIVLLYGDDKGDHRLETKATTVTQNTGWVRVDGSLTVPAITGTLRYAVWRIESDSNKDLELDGALLQ